MAQMDAISLVLVKNVALAYYFVAPCPPPTLPPCRSASGTGKCILTYTIQVGWYVCLSATHSVYDFMATFKPREK